MYRGKLFYARDAFDGLHAMDELTQKEPTETAEQTEKARTAVAGNGSKSPTAVNEITDQIETVETSDDLVGEDAKLGKQAARVSSRSSGDTSHTTRSDISTDITIPQAPFYGSKVVEIKDLTKVFAFINETALFKGQWQFKQGRRTTEEYQQILQNEVYPRF